MANNFLMKRAGVDEPWSKSIPSGGGTLTGSSTFEVKPTGINNASYDLTGRIEVSLVNASKKLICNLRQKGHREEDEDPGKQYKFYFRGKAVTDINIFIGVENDGRLLSDINATNQDIADYQVKDQQGKIVRNSTFYIDIFSYYLQGTKVDGQYVFVDSAENRVQVPITISNLPEWLSIDRAMEEVTGISDGGVENCTCYRVTLKCEQLNNYNEDDTPTDYSSRFPLDIIVPSQHRGIPRTSTLRIQPDFGNQKEVMIKQYGGYRNNFIFGKELELNSIELSQAAYGYYELSADNSGSMARYNKNTLQKLPLVDFGRYEYTYEVPTVSFIFKLGSTPTSEYHTENSSKYCDYIGYPWVLSGLQIRNTLDYGDNLYDVIHIEDFHNLVQSNSTTGSNSTWQYKQSNSIKTKLGLDNRVNLHFHIDIISLNDLFSIMYNYSPIKETGDISTLRSHINVSDNIPYINIPNIINGKRSLTAKEYQGYSQWMVDLRDLWRYPIHNTRLGDCSSLYLLVPRLHIVVPSSASYNPFISGAILNEWLVVENAESSDSINAEPALNNLTWGSCNFTEDSTSIHTLSYDEMVQFRFKLIS